VTGEPARGTIDAAWLKPPSTEFRLGPGDHVRVAIAGEPDSAVETVVAPDGKLYYQMLSGIDVWGQTLGEARSALANALKQYYQNSPAVSLTLLEIGSKHVWILGRLGSPGLYPLNGPTTLLDAIAAAGGPGASETVAQLPGGATVTIADPRQDAGDLSQAFVVRQGKPLPVDLKGLLRNGDMSQNIYLQPDDLIYLPSPHSPEVYVLGSVARASAVRMPGQMTLIGAVASAGGTADGAYLSHVAIVRGGVAAPTIAVYNYRAIVSGQAPDVRLEPNDIVYVPRSPYAGLASYLDLIVTTFARTVGVNAGARAADVNRNVSIAVPVGP